MTNVAMIGVGKLGQDAEVMAETYPVVGYDVSLGVLRTLRWLTLLRRR